MIEQIRKRLAAATPGPWGWYGNTDVREIHLATRDRGRLFIMRFVRWGMQDAQPMFQPVTDGGPLGAMARASERPRYEVAPDAISRDDPRVYRADINGIRHPDAELIAKAPEDIAYLLDRIDEIREAYETWGRMEISDAEFRDRLGSIIANEKGVSA